MATKYDNYTKHELVQLLVKRDAERPLGTVWERDEIEHDRALNNDFVTLEIDEEHSTKSDVFKNLLIEGDNFDALRYLNIAYKEKIKTIYIDPPYNTGNKDFIYNDHYIDKNDSYRHSTWLEFMYRRLNLAKDLLREDGVFFVSIDDNEFALLKGLMDKVFGEQNYITTLVWQTDGNFDNQAKIKISHEYILMYAKNEEQFVAPPIIEPYLNEDSKIFKSEIRNTIVKNGPKNPPSEITLPAGFPCEFEQGIISRRDDRYPHFLEDAVVENYELKHSVKVYSGWQNKNLLLAYIDQGFEFVFDQKGQPSEFTLNENGTIECIKKRSEDFSYVTSIIRNVGSVQKTSTDLKKYYGLNFDYPKPIGLIQYLISLSDDPNGIFLDFFAGSGTLGKTIGHINQIDSGNRKFILVSSSESTEDEPEKNICRDITRKRLSTSVIDKKVHVAEGVTPDFAYMRTIRIPREFIHDDIRHDQIWYALQQLHFEQVSLYRPDELCLKVNNAELTVIYMPETSVKHINAMKDLLSQCIGQIVVYSWTPAVIKQSFNDHDLTAERIPDFLIDRFGGGAQ